jgi:predicted ATPase/transcriptional regulator with XRE-family HTH domain
MMEFGSFGTWLKHRRRELDLTQAELSRRVGCSTAAIRKIEADERKPSQQLAALLARELHISEAEKNDFILFARHILREAGSSSSFIAKSEMAVGYSPETFSNNLPTFLTHLIDRAQDIAAVYGLITGDEARWVTLIGPPGIGKTRLSIHCGEQALSHFRDGVWFVDLSGILEADFVLSTIGRTLSHLDLPQSPSLEQLTIDLKGKELLLILDNFEQVEAAVGDIAALLKGCPKIKALITSRFPLNIYGEYKYHVPTLSIPPKSAARDPDFLMQFEAVQLLVARARQFQTGFKISKDNAQEIIEVCTRMDGIPLALELAAASLRHLSLPELVQILRHETETNWLKQIGYPARDLPPRQRTLENAIAWSYTLLSPERQAFFSRLGIFTGWFESEAAAIICSENGTDVNRAYAELEYLTEHSLVQQSRFDGRFYWHMLEIIHEFALLQLTASERRDLESRHAKYYHSLLGNRKIDWTKINYELFFQINGDNLHQALRRAVAAANTDLALSLATALCDLWEHVGYLREGMDLIQQVISMPGTTYGNLRIDFLNRVSTLAWQQHHFDFALSLTDEAIEIAKSNQIDDSYPMLLNLKGRIFIEQGKYPEAYEALSECYELSLNNPAVFNPGVPLVQLGEVELALGNYAQAQSRLETALGYLKDTTDVFWTMGVTDLAEVALAIKDYANAMNQLQLAKDIAGRHVRRLLCYMSTLAGYLTLKSGSDQKSLQRAVQIYGAIESLKEYSGEVLVPFYVELNAARIVLTRQELEKGKWETAWQTGRRWAKGEMLARAIEDIFS